MVRRRASQNVAENHIRFSHPTWTAEDWEMARQFFPDFQLYSINHEPGQ